MSGPQQQPLKEHKEQTNRMVMVGNMLSRRYEQLLHAQKYTDCVFHVCEEQLKCHRIILGAASPVFEAMFYGPLQQPNSEIEIDDISVEIFKVLIEYIYTSVVDYDCLQLEACIELYYAAEKYMLEELITDALLAITQKLRFCNVLPALELSVCMNLDSLLDVCMTFFMRCCVNNVQFMNYLKQHYVHVSKDCVKAIIAACKEPHKLLIWYVYEWTRQECQQLGLTPGDSNSIDLVVHELEMGKTNWQMTTNASSNVSMQAPIQLVERCCYKACRPFTVDAEFHVWRLRLKSSQFVSVLGLILNSRLAPSLNCSYPHAVLPAEYQESLHIDLYELPSLRPVDGDGHNGDVDGREVIWSHKIHNQTTKYNCDLHLNWGREQGCVLTPDVEYELHLRWNSNAFGAEYPCSLQSSQVDGFNFIDGDSFSGSLVKGLRYINLVV